MKTAALRFVLVLASSAAAYDLHQYSSSRCTGSRNSFTGLNKHKGCVFAREDGVGSILNSWSEDADNDLVLALYSDKACCHANLVRYVEWGEDCVSIEGNSMLVKSYRVLDPNDPEEGGDYDLCESGYDDKTEYTVEGIPPTFS